jgi:hypothetical protein
VSPRRDVDRLDFLRVSLLESDAVDERRQEPFCQAERPLLAHEPAEQLSRLVDVQDVERGGRLLGFEHRLAGVVLVGGGTDLPIGVGPRRPRTDVGRERDTSVVGDVEELRTLREVLRVIQGAVARRPKRRRLQM